MEQKVSKETKHPVENASYLNQLFFIWTFTLFKKGSKNELTMNDIWPPLTRDKSEHLTNQLERAWNQQLMKCQKHNKMEVTSKNRKLKRPSLIKTIIAVFWFDYFIVSLVVMLEMVILRNTLPIFQRIIVDYFDMTNNEMSRNDIIFYTTGLILTAFCSTLTLHHTSFQSRRIGMKIRVACCSLIYRKSLKLSQASFNEANVGQAINILSNDVNRFDYLLIYFSLIWIAPFQITLAGFIMWQSIGIYTLITLGCLIGTMVPLQAFLLKISEKLRGLIACLTDRRIQLLSEVIAGIQVVKMYAWEKPFNKIISQIREKEIRQIYYATNVKAFYKSIFLVMERMILFITIVAFISTGNSLDAGIVFQLFSYVDILLIIMAICVPTAIVTIGESIISIKRIEDFLMLNEINEDDNTKINQLNDNLSNKSSYSIQIELEQVFANWIKGQLPPTLNNISLTIKGGELCTILGPVGCGKSSLLNVLLKELPISSGAIRFFRNTESGLELLKNNSGIKISYASQDPWLFSGTVRENILFGEEYDSKRYRKVTKVCSLLKDFRLFPNGDMTIVGERGASLSGGQRARINLARAVYKKADVYLLDDPLGAVDVQVGRQLFNDCIRKYLKGKTRILTTHQIYQLMRNDFIVIMERGVIESQGSFETLSKIRPDFNNMLSHYEEKKEMFNVEKIEMKELCENSTNEIINPSTEENVISVLKKSMTSLNNCQLISNKTDKTKAQETMTSEEKETGHLSYDVYIRYFRNGGTLLTFIFLIFIWIISQITISGFDYWLSYWISLESIKICLQQSFKDCKIDKSQYDSMINTPLFTSLPVLDENGFLKTKYAIYIHIIFIITCMILVPLRSFVLMRNFVLHATMRFFHINPSGRILNKFSKDVGTMDELVPITLLETAQIFFLVTGVLILVYVVNVWMIIPSFIMGIIIYIFLYYYLRVSQDLKRLEGIAKSPVFTHVTTTFKGITTIRSNEDSIEMMFRNKFDQLQDDHSGAWYLVIATNAALSFFLDLIACVMLSCICYSFILIGPDDTYGASVGLAISQSLTLSLLFPFGVKQSMELQSHMTSVERILHYTNIPNEDIKPIDSTTENESFNGYVEFKNVFLQYNKDEPAVLKDINLAIKPGWKVGVVGRTGAGKSSLISVLFRLVDDGMHGKVLIDKQDIKKIDLHYLRSNISIIPQEPVLFSETLRYNLDPLQKYSDFVIWETLKKVELSDLMLDQKIFEGGKNFSIGQRQLICLARALLRNNKILILDEATANIDFQTDALIQQTIKSKFIGCTVIVIAHRLNTIIDSDRVLVMDAGEVVEFDSPYNLIFNRENSLFKQMIEQTDPTMSNQLYKEAAIYHQQKNSSFQSFNSEDDMVIDVDNVRIKNYDDTIEYSIRL
ncbi:LOW QUALITY PROTEIN: multidrug resistance-associated protein 4-like [Chelonus insularis]|uniref:LOW QUALITY PROTEIN: multidrug resistance-associated protein 4-like n=1 Tax=Chelonus insularis TaxID=460826 RepID=UPI00158E6125|nr:LOW QUALITY PROTEIN: multidrug resistance-associated protein 4-like [Chelonus insularis]